MPNSTAATASRATVQCVPGLKEATAVCASPTIAVTVALTIASLHASTARVEVS